MNFGERIKNLLQIRGMSRTELAARLNISITRLNHYINNRYEPAMDLLVQFSVILDTTVDYLLGRVQFYPSLKAANPLFKLKKGDIYDSSGLDNWLLKVMVYPTSGAPGEGPLFGITTHYGGYTLYAGGYFLRVDDDSMEPFLKKNDLAGVEPLRIDPYTVQPGKLYVIAAPGDKVGRIIRHAYIEGDRIIFTAAQSGYPPVSHQLGKNRYDIIRGHINAFNRWYE